MGFFDWVSKEVEEAKKRISSSFNQNVKQMENVISKNKQNLIKKVEKTSEHSFSPTASSTSLTTKIQQQLKKGFKQNVEIMKKEIAKKNKSLQPKPKPKQEQTTVGEVIEAVKIASKQAEKYSKPDSEITPVAVLPEEVSKYKEKGATIIHKKEVPKSTNPNIEVEDVKLIGKNKLGGYKISVNKKTETVPLSVAEKYFGKGLSKKEIVLKKHKLNVESTENKMVIKKPKGVEVSRDIVKEIEGFEKEGYNVSVKKDKEGNVTSWIITPKKQAYKDVVTVEKKNGKVILKHSFYDEKGKLLNSSQQTLNEADANLYLNENLWKSGYEYKNGKWVKTIYATPKFKPGKTQITSYIEANYPTIQGLESPINIALTPTTAEGIAWGELKNRWNLSDEEIKKLKKEYAIYSKKHPSETTLTYLLKRLKEDRMEAKAEGMIKPNIESMLESKGYAEELAWKDIKKKYNLSDKELETFKKFYKDWRAKAGAVSISTLKTGFGLGQGFDWMIKRATGKGPLEARVEAFTEPHLSEVVEAAKKPKIQYVGETALQTGISSSAVLLPMLSGAGGVAGTIGKVTLRAMQGYSIINAMKNPTSENIASAILFLAPDIAVKAIPKIKSIIGKGEVESVSLKPQTIISKEVRTKYGNKVLSIGTMNIKTNKGPKIKANLYQRLVKLKDGTVRREWLIEIPKQKVKIRGKSYDIPYSLKRFKSQEFIKSGIKYTIEQPTKTPKPPSQMSVAEKLNVVMKGEIKPSKISTPPSLKYTITQEKAISPTKEFFKIGSKETTQVVGKRSYIKVRAEKGVEAPAHIEFKKGSTPVSIEKGTLSARRGVIGKKYAKGEPPRDLINFREFSIKSKKAEFVFGKSRMGKVKTTYGRAVKEVSPETFFKISKKSGVSVKKASSPVKLFEGERKAFTKMNKKPAIKTTKEKYVSPKDLLKTESIREKGVESKASILTKRKLKESSLFKDNADFLIRMAETSIEARPALQTGNLGRIFGGFGSFFQAGLSAKTFIGPHKHVRIKAPKLETKKPKINAMSLLKMEQPKQQIQSLAKPLLAPDLLNISTTSQEKKTETPQRQNRILINKQVQQPKLLSKAKPIKPDFFDVKTDVVKPLVPFLAGRIAFGESKKKVKLKGGRLKRKFIKPEELLGVEEYSKQISPHGFLKLNKKELKRVRGKRRRRIVFNI